MGIALPPYTPEAPRIPGGAVAKPALPSAVSLSRGASLIRPPDLSLYYPYRARLKGITGETTVRLGVDVSGRVSSVQVLRSVPEGVFEAAARRVARALRFHPAETRGQPVATSVELDLMWRLE